MSTRWLVVGAARSGLAAVEALRRCRPDDRVVLTDRTAREGVALEGVETLFGREDEAILTGVDVLVKSPGVPSETPLVAAARRLGLPIWSEVELAYRLLEGRNPIVGVTGTNGKTTTTALAGAMLERGGVPSVVAGNIGTALTTLPGVIAPGATVVAELSSFQLEDVETFHARAAILLNVTPDHLDRHGTLEAYAAAKLRIFERQEAGDVAVLGDDDPWVRALGDAALPGAARRLRVRAADAPDDLREAFAASALEGDHNLANAACALAAAEAVGARRPEALAALAGFRALAHRLEPVGEVGGVRYVNDSKATNVEAAVRALESYPGGVHAILGGSLKGGSFAALAPAVAGHCRAVYLIGEAAPVIAADLGAAGVALRDCGTLAGAVAAAAAAAEPGEVVLLAPACASFDQFRDYEERGEAFRALVRELP